jgi:hypothetical protein
MTSTRDPLGDYLDRGFDREALDGPLDLPLVDEPAVACWRAWSDEAAGAPGIDVIGVLRRHLPQLAFPVRAGQRDDDAYRAATLRGVDPREIPRATGLPLARPEAIELRFHQTGAGHVPVLMAPDRGDFVALVQALARRNEPHPIPDSQGATIVAGYNNWTRLRALSVDQRRRLPEIKPLYQDRFLILSASPYSGVPASQLGLDPERWERISLELRAAHEGAHHLTSRLLGSMDNHLHDELLADHAGMVAATGRFRADWFDLFLGLDRALDDPESARLSLYRGDLPDQAIPRLVEIVRGAARTVEQVDDDRPAERRRSTPGRIAMTLALASHRLDELASPEGPSLLADTLGRISGQINWRGE